MARKSKYETHVKPHLEKIRQWYETMTEAQIASRLGVSTSSWENYKQKYPELRECLRHSKEMLAEELKATLKKKALGYFYEETKERYIPNKEGELQLAERLVVRKHMAPDLGSIHLLLKNLDDNWHNDDVPTMNLKKEQLEITKKKAENDIW